MTALTGIYLRNFQTIKAPTFIQLDKLCFLYGPNSAGKSSILDALDLINKTVTGETNGYRLGHLYGKHKHRSGDWDIGVGIEIIVSDTHCFTQDTIPNAKEWWSNPDQRGEYFHQDFFSKIKGKKIQIEFGGEASCIKIAIDGNPLFEFDEGSISYDDFYKKDCPHSERDTYDDQYLYGRLIIYKKNKLNKIYDCSYKEFSSDKGVGAYLPLSPYFKDLFVEEDKEKIVIYGLRFDAGREFQTGIVDLSYDVEQIIFPDYKRLKDYKADDQEYQNFIDRNFDETNPNVRESAQARKRIYWALEDISRDFEKLIKGFFYQAQFAIKYAHVRGDRQILNSNNCFSFPRYKNLDPKNCNLPEDDPMSIYARYLADPESWVFPCPIMKDDFINKALRDYLISLRGYEIFPEVFQLNKKENNSESEDSLMNSAGEIIFLKVRHRLRDDLGFQDVGSGISYVFPILTSLWASKMSFIEQPELHLHPSAQCELGDVFIAAYNKGANAVIESHSEHMLLRVLRRIRETTNNYLAPKELKFNSNNLRIYYFNPEPNGFTSVKEIRIDDSGELLNTWPGGFFSERDRELFDE